MKKILVVGIILLFIGIVVAPGINLTVVKASNDDDLVEVTTQASGIQGYKNTTITLTKEQYQDLERYLGEFRARLNQTSTREEAIPLFKEAVIELDKYGLLPKGISVQQAQKIVIGPSYTLISKNLMKRVPKNIAVNGVLNFFCLVTGNTNRTYPVNIFSAIPLYISGKNIHLVPFQLLGPVVFGKTFYDVLGRRTHYPSQGWIAAVGLNGLTTNAGVGPLTGALVRFSGLDFGGGHYAYYLGMLIFSGITIKNWWNTFLLGYTPCLALKEYSP